MNVIGLVEKQARTRPQAPAIIDVHRGRERSFTFGELYDEVTRQAALLKSQGIARGAGVLIFQPMSAELYIFLLALFHLGAVGLFVDPSAGRDHIERCCRMCPPRAFFGTLRLPLERLRLGFASSAPPDAAAPAAAPAAPAAAFASRHPQKCADIKSICRARPARRLSWRRPAKRDLRS